MTDEEIIEMAADIWNTGSSFPIPSSDDILTFARLIAATQSAIDAWIAEEIHDKCCVDVKYTDGYEIAAAIRGQKP
jgi:hypothetical protein